MLHDVFNIGNHVGWDPLIGMSRLRRVLDASNSSVRITTIRGSGYMLESTNGGAATMRAPHRQVISGKVQA